MGGSRPARFLPVLHYVQMGPQRSTWLNAFLRCVVTVCLSGQLPAFAQTAAPPAVDPETVQSIVLYADHVESPTEERRIIATGNVSATLTGTLAATGQP